MPNQTINAEVRTTGELKEEDLEWCDILHYSRHSIMSAKFLDSMRSKHGFKIIVDTDDWWEVHKDHPKYEFWKASSLSYQIQSHLMNADAVTCTHQDLASIVPNKNVYVLPNCLNYGKGQFKYRKPKPSDRVRLLYASTVMNYTNTAIIANAMKKLKHLNIEVLIAGHHESPFFDILVKNLTNGEIPYRFLPWDSTDKYMSNYEGDIGILPSKPTEFNMYKSNLKVLELAALKMPVVVSECKPYLDLPVNYFRGDNSFVEQVTALVEDANLRKERGELLYNFCKKNYNLPDMADERLKVYEIVQRSNSNIR